MANNENAIATLSAEEIQKLENFRLPEQADSDFTLEELSADMEGIQLSLPRVKIPSGGALQFEEPGGDPDDPEYSKTIEGILVFNHQARAYWKQDRAAGDDNVPPNCSSVDGNNGIGTPGGLCALCPMNAWGSSEKGRGKACKDLRQLYLLRNGDFLPTNLSLPPTSLKPFNDFMSTEFITRRRAACGSVIRIGLKRENNGKDDYSVAAFTRLYNFSGEKLAQVRKYSKDIAEQIKAMLVQQTVEAENRVFIEEPDDSVVVDATFSETAARLAMASVPGDLPL